MTRVAANAIAWVASFALLLGACYSDPPTDQTGCTPGVGTCHCPTADIPLLQEPEPFELATSAGRCAPVSCKRLLDGGVRMTYCFQNIDPTTSDPEARKPPFSGCTIARTDMRRFDAYYGQDAGDLEVTFCVGAPGVPGELNLWYGENPNRRLLRLVAKSQYAVAGCYVAHFESEQAQTPAFEEIPKACHEVCGADGGDVCQLDLTDGQGDPTRAPVAIVAESTAEPVVGEVWVESIRLVARRCRCQASADCIDPARPVCQPFAPVAACPASGAPGVCGAIVN
jgi:hypothetical protein